MSRSLQQPSQDPPGSEDGAAMAGTAGTTMPDADVAQSLAAAGTTERQASMPQQPPPAAAAASREEERAITAMQTNRRVTALWTINEVRNSWAHIDGIGWRKLANNSDSAIVALAMLMAHARQMNARVDYDDGTGMIAQAYIW